MYIIICVSRAHSVGLFPICIYSIGSSVLFHVLFYSLRLVFFSFFSSFYPFVTFGLLSFFFFNSIRGSGLTMVFNKLWVMESSPHVVECRRMLNAAAAATATTTTVMCGVVVYLCYIPTYQRLLSCILLLNRMPCEHLDFLQCFYILTS